MKTVVNKVGPLASARESGRVVLIGLRAQF